VNGFNVVCQQFIALYDSGCQICCNWCTLKPDFNGPSHLSTMPQINKIPHPWSSHFKLTLHGPIATSPALGLKWRTLNRCQYFSLDL